MANQELRTLIQKYRAKHARRLGINDAVIFKGQLYNKGIVEKIDGDQVHVRVPTGRNYMDENGRMTGREYVRHISEVIKREYDEADATSDLKFLFCNKFNDEDLGNFQVKWDEELEEDIFTIIDGKLINAARLGGDSCWKYVWYEKNGSNYLIPAICVVGIPVNRMAEWDVGIDSSFQVTREKDKIVFPVGRTSRVSISDIQRAFNVTSEARKKHAMSELAEVRNTLAQKTEELTGLMRRSEALSETIGLLEDKEIDEDRIGRAKRIIEDQWDDFEIKDDGKSTTIRLGAYIIYHHQKTGKKYDIGYCTVDVVYPDDLNSNPKVKISNSNKRNGHPHPFVAGNGQPCHGGSSHDAAQALASGDFERYAGYLYEFLTHAQGSGPYTSPTAWDEVKE